MTGWLGLLLDWRAWLVALVAGLALTNCATKNMLDREKLAHQASRAQFDETVRLANRAHAAAETHNRDLEKELNHANKTSAKAAQAAIDAARADARRSAADSERLRQQVAEFARAGRQACADPGAVSPGAAAGGDAIGVLADVLGRADARAGQLAAVADEARIRGLACETEYDRARAAVAASAVAPP